MKAKIICILVMTLLIATALTAVGTNEKKPLKPLPAAPQVLDQHQQHSDDCYYLSSGVAEWQEFLNRGNQIMYIELFMYNSAAHEAGFVRVSIEKPLGTILTKKILSCDDIVPGEQDIWFKFDVDPDVNLVKGQKYYIVFYYDGPCELCWHGAYKNKYPDGVSSRGDDWDFCFRTYVDKSTARIANTPFLNWMQNHPNMFPILQLFLQRLGL